ncbi:hypothetical protein ACLOJK_011538 [Asimina triloba]
MINIYSKIYIIRNVMYSYTDSGGNWLPPKRFPKLHPCVECLGPSNAQQTYGSQIPDTQQSEHGQQPQLVTWQNHGAFYYGHRSGPPECASAIRRDTVRRLLNPPEFAKI